MGQIELQKGSTSSARPKTCPPPRRSDSNSRARSLPVNLLFADSLQMSLEKALNLIEGDDLQIIVQIRMHGVSDN